MYEGAGQDRLPRVNAEEHWDYGDHCPQTESCEEGVHIESLYVHPMGWLTGDLIAAS